MEYPKIEGYYVKNEVLVIYYDDLRNVQETVLFNPVEFPQHEGKMLVDIMDALYGGFQSWEMLSADITGNHHHITDDEGFELTASTFSDFRDDMVLFMEMNNTEIIIKQTEILKSYSLQFWTGLNAK